MRNIRLGKTIVMRWKVTTNGTNASLSDRNLQVVLTNNRGKSKALDYDVVENNVIVATLQGKDNTVTGMYILTLWENRNGLNQSVVDIDAFNIVRRSEEEDDDMETEGLDVDVIELATANIEIIGSMGGVTDYNDLKNKPTADDIKYDSLLTTHKAGSIGAKLKELEAKSGVTAEQAAEIAKIAGKQDAISDLDNIRSGASKGATALQPVAGKGLSSNDYTDAEKAEVAKVSALSLKVEEAQADATSAAASASQTATYMGQLQEAINNLPDGQAVSEQVAENTVKIAELEGKGGGLSADAISMLISILNGAVYGSDMTNAIAELKEELKKGGGNTGVARPTLTEDLETYLVTMVSDDGDAVNIYYTTDGSTPSASSTLYSEPVSFREDCVIKAIAIGKATGKKSSVASFNYVAKYIDYIEFADSLVESTLLSAGIDKNKDGKIQKSEAAAATSLPLFNALGITSFDELEYFTGISTAPSFYNCKSLVSLKLPKAGNLKTINAFLYAAPLVQTLDIPEGVSKIGDNACRNAEALRNLTLPSTLESIGSYGFSQTAITRLDLPINCKSLGHHAFSSCKSLAEAHIEGVESIGQACFYATTALTKVYVPSIPPTLEDETAFSSKSNFYVASQEVKDLYMADTVWSTYGSSRFIIIS